MGDGESERDEQTSPRTSTVEIVFLLWPSVASFRAQSLGRQNGRRKCVECAKSAAPPRHFEQPGRPREVRRRKGIGSRIRIALRRQPFLLNIFCVDLVHKSLTHSHIFWKPTVSKYILKHR